MYVINNKDGTPRTMYYNAYPKKADLDDGFIPFIYFVEFKDIWNNLTIPDPIDIARDLEKGKIPEINIFLYIAGMNTMKTVKMEVRKMPSAKKVKKSNRKVKITNTHLVGIDLTKDYTPL